MAAPAKAASHVETTKGKVERRHVHAIDWELEPLRARVMAQAEALFADWPTAA